MLAICLGCIILLVVLLQFSKNNTLKVEGVPFNVQQSASRLQQLSARRLHTIKTKLDRLVEYMATHNEPSAELSNRLFIKYKTLKLGETLQRDQKVGYTVNKNEIRLCVRNGEELYDMNATMFVALHELAHVMSVSIGHTEEYQRNFRHILMLSANLGIYQPATSPVPHCGLVFQPNLTQ